MKQILDRINTYMSNGERWHEIGLILFYGIIIMGIVARFPHPLVWLGLCVVNVARVIYQEMGVERGWDTLRINHDFYYDAFSRPAGSAIIGLLPLLPQDMWIFIIGLTFIFTYKWKWFNM